MKKAIKVYTNGKFSGSIYQKQDGTHSTWSENDIIAVTLVIVLVSATVLSLLA